MKIGFIILCRYNSTRLPGKILKSIAGKPIIQNIVDKLSKVVDKTNIVVATSTEKTDNPIYDYCITNNIQVFRGNLNNVAKRFLDCATQFEFDFATRINGDNIFIDIDTISKMLDITKTNHYDFISNVKNRTFPKGMSVEIVRTAYYREQYKLFSKHEDYEHVTKFLYEHDTKKNHFYFYNTHCPEAAGIQLAIDTENDFILAENIFKHMEKNQKLTLTNIYHAYKKIKNNSNL